MAELKRVSFKVAKAIKEAGYPQEKLTDKVYLLNCDKEGKLAHYQSALYYNVAVAPTYLEIWLWLEKYKSILIHPDSSFIENGELKYSATTYLVKNDKSTGQDYVYNSSEEAIIAAIEHLVEHNLIK